MRAAIAHSKQGRDGGGFFGGFFGRVILSEDYKYNRRMEQCALLETALKQAKKPLSPSTPCGPN